jgi:phage terminase large subunit GpA-like protein
MSYELQIKQLLESSRVLLSNIKPSEWGEKNRIMTSDISPFPGPLSYDRTPYLREVVDCISADHPAKKIAVMKGAQIGFSVGVIETGIGWIISQNPGNILFLTGHADLSEEGVTKLDTMIDNSGLRPLIRPSALRAKNMRTGDTNKSKEFPGGSLVSGSAGNHKLLRQRSVRYGFIDDFDAAKQATKESGSTTKMIEQRFAAYHSKMKLFYISTPELKQSSNIEPVFLLGDQRRYFIPCPCCGEFISLHWSVDVEGSEGKERAGITWKVDTAGKLEADSVGYICQKCSGFFKDNNKYELNLAGHWRPTAEPSEPGYYSYHISSLYAPPGMYDWLHYVRQYTEAYPNNAARNEKLAQTFTNLCLGETYEAQGEAPKANELQKNIRNYDIGILPEKLSIADGNGKIILITCAADLNGREDDARLDYEVVAWSETGSQYSIIHGSIGTFVPLEGNKKHKEDRERWTYQHNKQNSVWPELSKILERVFVTDTGRRMKIFISGVDTGHYTSHAYTYIDNTNHYVVGLKGDTDERYQKLGIDLPSFKPAKERSKLFILQSNQIKDLLSDKIKLRWDSGNDDHQPAGFINFPTPSNGLYLFNNYFSHYEAEHRVTEHKEGQGVYMLWKKKNSAVQNHFFDVRCYNMALKDIIVSLITKELKIPKGTWGDYVNIIKGTK